MKAFLVVLLAVGAFAVPRVFKPKIVGGTHADVGEYPYQASIRMLNMHLCGGSIITSRTILTAGHCYMPIVPLTAVVGTNHILNGGASYDIQKMIVHPEFDLTKVANDVAVALLKSEIELNVNVQPITLGDLFVGGDVDCVLTGWGLESYPGLFPPEDLLEIQLRTISNEDCAKQHENTEGAEVFESQICTLTHEGEGACSGDSGGPLVATGHQIGIVSWGVPCGVGYPDVYTRVSSFKDWIEKNQL